MSETSLGLADLDDDGDLEWGPGWDPELADLAEQVVADIWAMAAQTETAPVAAPGAPVAALPAWAQAARPVPLSDPSHPAWIPGYTPGVARFITGGVMHSVAERPVREVRVADRVSLARPDAVVRVAAELPDPEVPAHPLALTALPASAKRLATAAAGAGWTVAAAGSRGPWPAEKSRCARCSRWAVITKAGALAVHGPRAARCQQTEPDPDSPAFATVDAVVVRAGSDSGHRLGGLWVAAEPDKYKLHRLELFLHGYRPRAVDMNELVAVLKLATSRPAVEQSATIHPATPDTKGE